MNANSLFVCFMHFVDDGSFLDLCYFPHWNVSAYAMGVVTRVVLTTTEGAEDKQEEEIEEIGSMIIETLLIGEDPDSPEHQMSLKVNAKKMHYTVKCWGCSYSWRWVSWALTYR